MRRFVLGLLVSLLALSVFLGAQTTNRIRVPQDVPSIQVAIDEATTITNGSTPRPVLIDVAPGTYNEWLYLGGLTSGWPVTLRSTAGAARTIIDSSGLDHHAFFGPYVKGFTLDGFTVRNRWDPLATWGTAGMVLSNPVNVTVQNCHFDTTLQAMQFNISDPALVSEVSVLHNTAFAGQGTDPNNADFTYGQGASLSANFGEGVVPTGWLRFVVADNVFRSTGSSVRFFVSSLDENGAVVGMYGNGSLIMIGNDVSSSFGGGTNTWGGTGNLIAGNHFHHSQIGLYAAGGFISVYENNLADNNVHGIWTTNGIPAVAGTPPGPVIRHNTVVNNLAVGFIYADALGDRSKLPKIYNNIIAFNGGGGLDAVDVTGDWPVFIPVALELARNDLYGNSLRNMQASNWFFSLEGVLNPEVATPNYAGVANTGTDIYASPDFYDMANGFFSLKRNSALVNAGYAAWGYPLQDSAGVLRDSQPDIGAFELAFPSKVKPKSAGAAATTKKTDK